MKLRLERFLRFGMRVLPDVSARLRSRGVGIRNSLALVAMLAAGACSEPVPAATTSAGAVRIGLPQKGAAMAQNVAGLLGSEGLIAHSLQSDLEPRIASG